MPTTPSFVSVWQNSNYYVDHFTFRISLGEQQLSCRPLHLSYQLGRIAIIMPTTPPFVCAFQKMIIINFNSPNFGHKILLYQHGSELRRRLRRISINRPTRMQQTWKTMFLPRSIGTLLFDIPAPPHLQLYYTRRLYPCLSRQEWMYFNPAHSVCHR